MDLSQLRQRQENISNLQMEQFQFWWLQFDNSDHFFLRAEYNI